MKVKDLKKIVNGLPDEFDVKLYVDDKDYPIRRIGRTATHHDGKTLYRPKLILIEG